MPRRYEDFEDTDVFDENGILKDGKRVRVPMMMMDALQRAVREHSIATGTIRDGASERPLVVDALGRPAGQRSGTCYSSTSKDSVAHAKAVTEFYMRDQAYRDYCDELCNAWRSPNAAPSPAVEHRDAMLAREAVEEARRQMMQDACNAWKDVW